MKLLQALKKIIFYVAFRVSQVSFPRACSYRIVVDMFSSLSRSQARSWSSLRTLLRLGWRSLYLIFICTLCGTRAFFPKTISGSTLYAGDYRPCLQSLCSLRKISSTNSQRCVSSIRAMATSFSGIRWRSWFSRVPWCMLTRSSTLPR
jgi:hypothetical protein